MGTIAYRGVAAGGAVETVCVVAHPKPRTAELTSTPRRIDAPAAEEDESIARAAGKRKRFRGME
jgi:hypothetical protein